ncbi:hypothetical protein cyc_04567 [Cyclospora cayetanensis]|uniref:Uncharacterized protein n=1 Tax=Cyclospora cayetanensis TaxID=88456 RepID=A0A1D3CUM3_9EIME|nr:hypothetical protein cyc_04567 [Cyclospora cayetanensis]
MTNTECLDPREQEGYTFDDTEILGEEGDQEQLLSHWLLSAGPPRLLARAALTVSPSLCVPQTSLQSRLLGIRETSRPSDTPS